MQRGKLIAIIVCLAVATPATAKEPVPKSSTHEAERARPEASLLLELIDWHCAWNNRLVVSVEGSIKNISSYTVPKVVARIIVTDEDGRLIGSGDRFADKAPFTPEAQASFKGQIRLAEGTKRPRSCSIDFVDGDGTYLRWREAPA